MSDALDRIEVCTGDITQLAVDAIVNAANESLLGGGGVDGATHRAAGPRLLNHNRKLNGCLTGSAKITPSFDLSARGIKHIIHTVGPVWHAGAAVADGPIGDIEVDVLLASCYVESLTLAVSNEVETIAFPAISTGVYHFPKPRAAKIAVGRAVKWCAEHELPQKIVFCCFSEADAEIYRRTFEEIRAS